MKTLKGTIALDIDGTLTTRKDSFDQSIQEFLENLVGNGWNLIFVTGRTFSFAQPLFSTFKAPFSLAVQNGAILYEMPGEKLVVERMIPARLLGPLNQEVRKFGLGLIVESGRISKDISYYVPEDFSLEDREYLQYRMTLSKDTWKPLKLFDEFSHAAFAAGKIFAKAEIARQLVDQSIKIFPHTFSPTIIRDPFRPGYHIVHLTDDLATKGKIVSFARIKEHTLIAAGDDYNDVDMLNSADIKIIMRNAPAELYSLADIIAPSVHDNGIKTALEEALLLIKKGKI